MKWKLYIPPNHGSEYKIGITHIEMVQEEVVPLNGVSHTLFY